MILNRICITQTQHILDKQASTVSKVHYLSTQATNPGPAGWDFHWRGPKMLLPNIWRLNGLIPAWGKLSQPGQSESELEEFVTELNWMNQTEWTEWGHLSTWALSPELNWKTFQTKLWNWSVLKSFRSEGKIIALTNKQHWFLHALC